MFQGKRLTKKPGMIAGVCAGIADYFNIDANIIRIAAIIFGLTGTGILAYIIAALILPNDNVN